MFDRLEEKIVTAARRLAQNRQTKLPLTSGRYAVVGQPTRLIGPHYHVIYYPETQPTPSPADLAEMQLMATALAKRLALAAFGDAECYMVLFNGLGIRRARNHHYHILPLRGRVAKFRLYGVLTIKNLLYPLWRGLRPLRRRL